jgi:hypothetical protein
MCEAFQARETYLEDGSVFSLDKWEMTAAIMIDDARTEQRHNCSRAFGSCESLEQMKRISRMDMKADRGA